MKFKPGDLVIIKCENLAYNGRIAEIVREAPNEPFVLPDGCEHSQPSEGGWVIRLYGEPVKVLIYNGDEDPMQRLSRWGVGGGTKMEKIGNVDEIVLAWVARNFGDLEDNG